MITEIITNEEIRECGVSSLPTRPTAPTAFGGRGYTASELKAAFDRLPCLIIDRLNSLITEVGELEGRLTELEGRLTELEGRLNNG